MWAQPARAEPFTVAGTYRMQRANTVIGLIGIAWIGLTTSVGFAQKPAATPPRPAPATARAARPAVKTVAATAPAAAADHNAVIKRYCATCHSDTRKSGGLSLAAFDVAQAAHNAEVAEKVIRKLQAGMMPPPLAPRPDAA